jgi:hypothetical protein
VILIISKEEDYNYFNSLKLSTRDYAAEAVSILESIQEKLWPFLKLRYLVDLTAENPALFNKFLLPTLFYSNDTRCNQFKFSSKRKKWSSIQMTCLILLGNALGI